jgi:hypothetical protein
MRSPLAIKGDIDARIQASNPFALVALAGVMPAAAEDFYSSVFKKVKWPKTPVLV